MLDASTHDEEKEPNMRGIKDATEILPIKDDMNGDGGGGCIRGIKDDTEISGTQTV